MTENTLKMQASLVQLPGAQFPSSSTAAKPHRCPTRLHQLQVSFGHKYRLAVSTPMVLSMDMKV